MERHTKIALVLGGSFLALGALAYAFRKPAARYVLKAHHERHIEKLHPGVQKIFRQFIDEVERYGWSVIITSSYRSHKEQEALVRQNYKHAVEPGNSPHNYGFAIDINLQKGLKLVNMSSSVQEWEATGAPAFARMLGIRWGGVFSGKNKGDLVHFDYWLRPLSEMKRLAMAQNIEGNRVKLA